MSSARSTRCACLGLRHAAHLSGKATFSANRHVREQRVVLEHDADVALVRRQVRRCGLPSSRMAPAVGASKPASIIRIVVLPDPDGPRRLTNSPCSISRSSASTTVSRAEGLCETNSKLNEGRISHMPNS